MPLFGGSAQEKQEYVNADIVLDDILRFHPSWMILSACVTVYEDRTSFPLLCSLLLLGQSQGGAVKYHDLTQSTVTSYESIVYFSI